ncbi:hypothetical protein FTO70_15665 [Methanosarcina sp. KYL-1]|uniref:hypothetical protein n=1 Tax=Methanosarcina sp. KYL-1 TaxID=2602068 RepID=UPI0021012D4F|nr:hypothetical protein [Methanosarcina sp. KYL-1]MCQ1537083.1 hypothetical protein [Methanosarcina sp. KYL-1]
MEKLRSLIVENVSIFNEAFPNRFCPSPDVISAISHDHPFTYCQVENEIEKLVHEGVLEPELSDCYRIKLP